MDGKRFGEEVTSPYSFMNRNRADFNKCHILRSQILTNCEDDVKLPLITTAVRPNIISNEILLVVALGNSHGHVTKIFI